MLPVRLRDPLEVDEDAILIGGLTILEISPCGPPEIDGPTPSTASFGSTHNAGLDSGSDDEE